MIVSNMNLTMIQYLYMQLNLKGYNKMAKLESMMNIGKEMKIKLMSVGIYSAEDLVKTGSKEAFYLLKERYPNICLVHLYTLQGAIDNIEYNQLSNKIKCDLKKYSDRLK